MDCCTKLKNNEYFQSFTKHYKNGIDLTKSILGFPFEAVKRFIFIGLDLYGTIQSFLEEKNKSKNLLRTNKFLYFFTRPVIRELLAFSVGCSIIKLQFIQLNKFLDQYKNDEDDSIKDKILGFSKELLGPVYGFVIDRELEKERKLFKNLFTAIPPSFTPYPNQFIYKNLQSYPNSYNYLWRQ